VIRVPIGSGTAPPVPGAEVVDELLCEWLRVRLRALVNFGQAMRERSGHAAYLDVVNLAEAGVAMTYRWRQASRDGDPDAAGLGDAVRRLGYSYADADGYRPEWRPRGF
jgi:hypothetical protein